MSDPSPQTSAARGYEQRRRDYVIGLILCILLTVIPFAMVAMPVASYRTTLVVVVLFAAAQIVVQMRYFLGLGDGQTPPDKAVALALTCLLLLLIIGGSLWVMFDLHHRMM